MLRSFALPVCCLVFACATSPGTTAITVRATAMFDETVAVVHEAKLNVAVGK